MAIAALERLTHPASTEDPVWAEIRAEAEAASRNDPALSRFFQIAVLDQPSLEAAVAARIADALGNLHLPPALIRQEFAAAVAAEPAIRAAIRADIDAVVERDPAANRRIEPLLFFKGFAAIETHRLAHWLWRSGREDFALLLQSRSSSVFQTDIHPAARFGQGLFFDHATGIVIGSTALIEDDVSLLQDVTLGGTGKGHGDRHPKVRHGVLIGAGAKVLGNIEIGHCARIAAGSMVLRPVPPCVTVAGVPARIVGKAGCAEPARAMDQVIASTD